MPSPMRRIAFISTILHYPWGGADTLWTHAAEAASARGDRLLLSLSPLTAEHPRVRALVAAGTRLHCRAPESGVPTLANRLLRKLHLQRTPEADLVHALQSFAPDLVVFSQGGTYDLLQYPALVAWLHQQRVPYRVIANWQREHPELAEREWHLVRRALTLADQLCFVSTPNLESTRRHLNEPLANARVIQNPLRWQPGDVSPWPAASPLQLATVSRLHHDKGVQLLLHALAALPDAPAWRLNIYGHGPAEWHLRATVESLNFTSRVNFQGHVGQLREIWAHNHLLVSPALEDGVPMTIPEAMLCERPVLATAVGGATDWLRDGVTGFICPAPHVRLLSSTLERAFAMREQWPEIGRAAARAAAAHYRADDYLSLLA